MEIKKISKQESIDKYLQISKENFTFLGELSADYMDIRNYILQEYQTIDSLGIKEQYIIDVRLGIALYHVLESKYIDYKDLNDPEFWYYLSLYVMPDIVKKRWVKENLETRFYSKNVRIYPYTLYWYIRLSYESTLKETEEFLLNNGFNTDTILQIVERPGKNGFIDQFYSSILRKYAEVSKQDRGLQNENYLRRILVLHTAKMEVIVPEFFTGGIKEYVEDLDRIITGDK